MKLFRKSPQSSGRQRRQPAGEAPGYRASGRSQTDANPPRDRRLAQQAAAGPARSIWRFWAQRLGLLVLLTAVIISLFNILSLSTNAKVLPVGQQSKGSFLRDQATYEAAADQFLAGSIWNRNKVTIDTGRFRQQMKSTFPELADVSLALPLLAHRPVVYLEPAQPAMVLSAANGSFVLDTNGRALLSSADLASTKGLPQVTDQSGLQIERNHQVLAADDVRFIQTVSRQLAAKRVGVAAMTLPPSSSELDVRITGQPYQVKFNLRDDDPRRQVGTYLATIATLQRQKVTPAKYVDVRVDGRAYYQ